MILAVGEILFDIFPEYVRLGGAPFNFACHLKVLGFPIHFITRIGTDENGNRILQVLKEKGFDLKYIQKDQKHKTGRVMVSLDDKGSPNFNIIKNAAYDYLSYTDDISSALAIKPKLIYYGTLIQRTKNGAATLMKILENRSPETKCFYDINLRQDGYNKNIITKSLIHCDILKLNDDELKVLKSMFAFKSPDTIEFIHDLMQIFNIEWVCLTLGHMGSSLFTQNGVYKAVPESSLSIKDTVGAGDAFSAILAAGYLENWKPDQIMQRAAKFAGAICEYQGAVPEDNNFYQPYSDWLKTEEY